MYIRLAFATFALLIAAACRGNATPSPTATPQVIATAPATPTPSPTATPLAFPLAQGAEIPPVVRAVVTAGSTGGIDALAALAKYQQVGCTTATGAGGAPKCKAGDTPGTVYTVFATGSCEGEWSTDAKATVTELMKQPPRLYAAASLKTPSPDPDPLWPKGQYAVLFATGQSNPAGVYFVLDATGIVRAQRTCAAGETGEQTLRALGAVAFLIPPV